MEASQGDDSMANRSTPRLLYQLIRMEKEGVPLTPNEAAVLEHMRQQESSSAVPPKETPEPVVTRLELLEQLRLAKDLRCRLEKKVAHVNIIKKATPDYLQFSGKRILHEGKEEVLELAALQDAVDGGYALPSYDHYKKIYSKEEASNDP